jgi:hypothetical protein
MTTWVSSATRTTSRSSWGSSGTVLLWSVHSGWPGAHDVKRRAIGNVRQRTPRRAGRASYRRVIVDERNACHGLCLATRSAVARSSTRHRRGSARQVGLLGDVAVCGAANCRAAWRFGRPSVDSRSAVIPRWSAATAPRVATQPPRPGRYCGDGAGDDVRLPRGPGGGPTHLTRPGPPTAVTRTAVAGEPAPPGHLPSDHRQDERGIHEHVSSPKKPRGGARSRRSSRLRPARDPT